MIQSITATELKEIFKEKNSSILVDVRTQEEWEVGSIPGAQHIPLSQILNHVGALKRFDKVYLYCRSGSRSEAAANLLKINGIQNPINVEGGIMAWQRSTRHT